MSPITRRHGTVYVTGCLSVSIPQLWEHHEAGYDVSAILREYPNSGLTHEAVDFALAYWRKRLTNRERRRNDPKRAQRLAGKRNSAAGRRAEEWIVRDLGPAWRRKAGAGRCDVEYVADVPPAPVIRVIESKRRKGADTALRRALLQNHSDALVRSYGAEPGVRQAEPLVILRWPTFRALLKAAGQEIA